MALIVFALFHHVLPRSEKAVGIESKRVASAQVQSVPVDSAAEPVSAESAPVESAEAPQAAATELPPDPVGVFKRKFADKFTDGEVIFDENGYQSANINIRFSKHQEPELVYYVTDIYLSRIECLTTVFAKDKFGRGHWERLTSICERMKGILTVNGDYYGGRSDGVVIRNGKLYRDDKNPLRDICVINWDGTFETYHPNEWDSYRAMENGAYQAWNFGPALFDESGNAKESFDSEVSGLNPRTAIGYYEPGHYCFVVVDGRSNRSRGITLPDLSALMHSLGCAKAYNFDGGASSEMVVDGKTVNRPADGGRSTSDAVLIVEP